MVQTIATPFLSWFSSSSDDFTFSVENLHDNSRNDELNTPDFISLYLNFDLNNKGAHKPLIVYIRCPIKMIQY
jgi:hypothetical protein